MIPHNEKMRLSTMSNAQKNHSPDTLTLFIYTKQYQNVCCSKTILQSLIQGLRTNNGIRRCCICVASEVMIWLIKYTLQIADRQVTRMKKGYLIGEVNRITGISRDTLRFYDRINLLKPSYVDPENNYRYYTYDQFWSLDIINCCRNLDIPIEKIRLILKSKDNQQVLSFLLEHRDEALRKSAFFQRIAQDIDWYEQQQHHLQQTKSGGNIKVRHIPERKVLYGSNADDSLAYHLKLQELLQQVTDQAHSIRRNYGFILEETKLQDNAFIKKGEYIQFDKDVVDTGVLDSRYLTTLPEGEYACFLTEVTNQSADFSPLLHWLCERDITPEYVTADEIGLQLFDYLGHGYLCEIQVLLP